MGTHAVITAIELLSPKKKYSGEGRTAYEKKRLRILGSASHLVEIDLLPENLPMPMLGAEGLSDYRIVVSRATTRTIADLYGFCLPEPVPIFGLPLKSEDAEIKVELQGILLAVYEQGSYAFRIDYRQPVLPPKLSPVDQAWVDKGLASVRSKSGIEEIT